MTIQGSKLLPYILIGGVVIHLFAWISDKANFLLTLVDQINKQIGQLVRVFRKKHRYRFHSPVHFPLDIGFLLIFLNQCRVDNPYIQLIFWTVYHSKFEENSVRDSSQWSWTHRSREYNAIVNCPRRRGSFSWAIRPAGFVYYWPRLKHDHRT